MKYKARAKRPILSRAFDKLAFDKSGCWLWGGSLSTAGYGRINTGEGNASAHRILYSAFRGEIPRGLELDHLCRVRNCVNPFHLEPVTRSENMRRSPLVGRWGKAKTHCPKGHEYAGDNLYVDKTGRRHCRECGRNACNTRNAIARQTTKEAIA